MDLFFRPPLSSQQPCKVGKAERLWLAQVSFVAEWRFQPGFSRSNSQTTTTPYVALHLDCELFGNWKPFTYALRYMSLFIEKWHRNILHNSHTHCLVATLKNVKGGVFPRCTWRGQGANLGVYTGKAKQITEVLSYNTLSKCADLVYDIHIYTHKACFSMKVNCKVTSPLFQGRERLLWKGLCKANKKLRQCMLGTGMHVSVRLGIELPKKPRD